MSELVADCPRCGACRMTFDLRDEVHVGKAYDWKAWLEVFCVCRNCHKPTIFLVVQKQSFHEKLINDGLVNLKTSVNQIVDVKRFIGIQDNSTVQPPEHLPEKIEAIFIEGASCKAIGCNNAAATMFRLCLDLATQALLPQDGEGLNNGLNNKVKRNLGLRLTWLFNQGLLPTVLLELSSCIKDGGNDGAHEGILGEEDVDDILDFTSILLERLYTEPKRLELAAQRRIARREG